MAKEKRSHQAVGRMSRRKGAAYELQIAKRLQAIFPGAKRGLGQARSGHEAADVENTPGWWVQTKHGKRPNLFEALEQSDLDRSKWASLNGAHESWRKPLVIARKNGEKDIATLYLDDFLEILQTALKNVEAMVKQVLPEVAEKEQQELIKIAAEMQQKQLYYLKKNGEVKKS